MMQVENEVGVLGDSRDRSDEADHAFNSPVPAELTRYLKAHHDTLYPRLRELWDENGDKTSGTWPEIFGNSNRADEIFMAWHYARFVHAVTAAGKVCLQHSDVREHLARREWRSAGSFPSGGPEPWAVDIWRAAGTAIDSMRPTLRPDFVEWCRQYHRDGNPLFMPETRGGAPGAANVFYAVGEESALDSLPSQSKTTWIPNRILPPVIARSGQSPRSSLNVRPPETYTASSSTSNTPPPTSRSAAMALHVSSTPSSANILIRVTD